MKKLIFGGLFLGLVAIGFVGCKKENLSERYENKLFLEQRTSNTSVYASDGIVYFPTVEYYDSLLSLSAKDTSVFHLFDNLKFTSLERHFENDTINLNPIDDRFLSTVLNSDMIVCIGNYFYKVNKAKESVYSLPTKNKTEINDLISENTSNKNIQSFSTEDDVFYELKERKSDSKKELESFEEKSLSKKCSNSKIDGTNGWVTYLDEKVNGKKTQLQVDVKVEYINFGIARKLHLKFNHRVKKGNSSYKKTKFAIGYDCSYTTKNGEESGHVGFIPSETISGMNYYGQNHDLIIYNGSHCLGIFDAKGWFIFQDPVHTSTLHRYPSNYSIFRIIN